MVASVIDCSEQPGLVMKLSLVSGKPRNHGIIIEFCLKLTLLQLWLCNFINYFNAIYMLKEHFRKLKFEKLPGP